MHPLAQFMELEDQLQRVETLRREHQAREREMQRRMQQVCAAPRHDGSRADASG